MIITIDGPIATGKSSIAKKLAERLGFIHFDTGAMYRCLTYALLKQNVNYHELSDLQKFLDHFNFDIQLENGEKRYLVDKEDVTYHIRGQQVTEKVSEVSAIKEVRIKLVTLQQKWAQNVDAVFEGRDLGTDVFPNADLKIFLTGQTEIRAKRRFDELRAKFPKETEALSLEQTIEDINRRDIYDSTRKISPLRQAEDAFVVDTTELSIDQIVEKIILLKERANAHEN